MHRTRHKSGRKGRTRSARRAARRRLRHHPGVRPPATPAAAAAKAIPVVPPAQSAWRLRSPRFYPATAAAMLLGLSAGLILLAILVRFQRPSLFASARPALAGALFAFALGVRVPRHIAAWLAEARWPRRRRPWDAGDARTSSWPDLNSADVPFYWMIVAVLAMVVGFMALAMSSMTHVLADVLAFLEARFLWSSAASLALEVVLAFLVSAAVLAPLAMLLVGLHHLYDALNPWDVRALCGFLAGLAPAVACLPWLAQAIPIAVAGPTLAALPLFAVSVVAVMASRSPATGPDAARCDAPQPPILQDRRPTVVRAAIVLAWLCAVAWADEFVRATSESLPAASARAGGYGSAGLMLLAGSAGALAGVRATRRRSPSISGFGAACAVALLIAASARFAPFTRPQGCALAAAVAAMAFAAAYGTAALLIRVGSRTAAGGTLLGRMAAAAALWLAVSGAFEHQRGVLDAAHSAVYLALALLGGILILREPTHHVQRRRLRLALAAAAVCLAFAVML